MSKPECYCYYPRYSGNYGRNAMAFIDPFGNKFYFSYQTLIGFYSVKLRKEYFLQNYWQNTTARHMFELSRKENRLPQEAFDAMFDLAFSDAKLKVYTTV